MRRYEPTTDDGTLYLVSGDHRVEVGLIEQIIEAVGVDAYTIEYSSEQQPQPWLETSDGQLDIDIREAVTSMDHPKGVVERLQEYDMDDRRYGMPRRTVEFAQMFVGILDEQGES